MFKNLMFKEKVNLYIYEVKKGTKPVCLFTTPIEHKDEITHIITSAGLVCKTVEMTRNVNYFFSLPETEDCIDAIMSIINNRKVKHLLIVDNFCTKLWKTLNNSQYLIVENYHVLDIYK